MRILLGRRLFCALTLSACLGLSACHGGSDPAASSPTPHASPTTPEVFLQDPGMDWGTPLQTEDFSQPLNPDRWTVYDAPTKKPYPTSGQNVSVAGGELQLDGKQDGPTTDGGAFRDQGAGIASTLNQVYGRWEARIEVEPGAGYAAAMTVWPHSNVWPRDGEIDVMEVHDPARTVAQNTIHNGVANHVGLHKNHGLYTGWHVYGVDWEPDSLRYYLDGRLVYTVTDPELIPDTPMHDTLQFVPECKPSYQACRGSGTPAVVSMAVDWVKVFAPAAG